MTDAKVPPGKSNGLRTKKLLKNRRALFHAEVVVELGYADTSIARITQRAGRAQGTFYLYFSSR